MLQILCKTLAAIFKIQILANTKSKFNNFIFNQVEVTTMQMQIVSYAINTLFDTYTYSL